MVDIAVADVANNSVAGSAWNGKLDICSLIADMFLKVSRSVDGEAGPAESTEISRGRAIYV